MVCARDFESPIRFRWFELSVAVCFPVYLLVGMARGMFREIPFSPQRERSTIDLEKNPRTGSGRGHKNAGRARLRVARPARHRCFMADSFVCSAVGIIFPSKLRYTGNNGEIKT